MKSSAQQLKPKAQLSLSSKLSSRVSIKVPVRLSSFEHDVLPSIAKILCHLHTGPRHVRFPHRSLRHDQLLRAGRERVQSQTQVQPGGENAPAMRTTTRKKTRRLKMCQTPKTFFFTFLSWVIGKI